MIPEGYLPPKDHLPDKIYALPEVRFPFKVNLGYHFLDRHVDQGLGSKIAIFYEDREITFSELQSEVNRLANGLLGFGVMKDDRIMLRLSNRPEFIVACLACWKLGAIPVLVHHLLKRDEIIFRANDSESRVAIVSSDVFGEVEKALSDCHTIQHIIVVSEKANGYISYADLLRAQDDKIRLEDTAKNDWMRIIYTSGTTGKPKGVINTIGDMLAGVTIANTYLLKISKSDVLGSHPAFSFAFGFFSILFFGLTGCSLVVIDRFDSEKMFASIERRGITVLRCVPTVYRMMLDIKDAEKKYDLGSLRICQSAGEMLPGIVARDWKSRFGVTILNSLGSADLNSFMSTHERTPHDKLDSSGMPLPGIDAKIVDEDFKDVLPGERGELILRAPWGIQYWRRPEAQANSIRSGWNKTGLIFTEDSEGYYWFKGRNDDMIVSSGYKIPGGEVEAVLLSHQAVHEAAAVASPDPVRGNIVKAFIVLNENYLPSDQLVEELQIFVKEKIEPYKYPRQIVFVDPESLPRTSTGKIQRFVLREQEKLKAGKI
jgi:2-aminobenzoate-CoA ligase